MDPTPDATTDTRRPRGGRRPIAAFRLDDFLTQLGETGSVTEAALRCGLRRSTLYALRQSSQSFARRWQEALDRGVDRIQDGAMAYAINGHLRPVWFRGQQVGVTQHIDPRFMQFMLRAHRPDLYNRAPAPPPPPPPDPSHDEEWARQLDAADARVAALRARQKAAKEAEEKRAEEARGKAEARRQARRAAVAPPEEVDKPDKALRSGVQNA